MPTRRLLLIFIGFVLLFALLLGSVLRSLSPIRNEDGGVIFADRAFLVNEARGELVVFGQSSIRLDPESRIDGNVALLSLNGEPVQIDGIISGDLTVIGSEVTLARSSSVAGSVTLIGDNLTLEGEVEGDATLSAPAIRLAPTATIAGRTSVCAADDPQLTDLRAQPSPLSSCDAFVLSPINSMVLLFLGGIASLAFTGLSALFVTIFPRQVAQMEEAIRRRPRKLVGIGLAAVALAVGIAAALLIIISVLPPLGLILTPVYLIFTIGLFAAVLAGGITLALMTGDWLLQQFGWSAPPMITAIMGGMVIMLPSLLLQAFSVLSVVPLLGLAALGALALGAALDTRMGTRASPRRYFVQG